MSNCKNFKKQIILLHYNELDRSEKTELLKHLQICPDCKRELEEMKQFGRLLQEQPLFEVDENNIKKINNLIRLKIKKQRNKKFVPFTFIHPKPAFQYGFVVLLIMFGFLLGRQNFINRNPIQTQNPLQQLLTAGGPVSAANSNINPYLIGVERLKFNPREGTIEIQYNTMNDILLKGTPETPAIKDLLLHAMANEQNPNVRLHAVKVVNAAAQSNRNLDVDYVNSLEQILLKEENPGIKLLALDVLKTLPMRENIKNILVRVLLYDPDTPVRIQAFKTLTEAQITKTDIEKYLQPSLNDTNRYISYKSEKLIEQLKEQKTGPFELSRKGKQ
ncbi:hypothetical protein JXQ31_17940 [candidate division KSB1 bacterium]|nr:hypothetical protein [candidate division KSB1 bacterium]